MADIGLYIAQRGLSREPAASTTVPATPDFPRAPADLGRDTTAEGVTKLLAAGADLATVIGERQLKLQQAKDLADTQNALSSLQDSTNMQAFALQRDANVHPLQYHDLLKQHIEDTITALQQNLSPRAQQAFK